MSSPTKEPTPMMTIAEIAKYLQLHPLTVRHLAKEGQIPAFKVGRQWRAKRALLDQWIKERSMQNLVTDEGQPG